MSMPKKHAPTAGKISIENNRYLLNKPLFRNTMP
jgi:hypothetical protein